ncbi:MAG: alkaline phosphatase family protein [Chloroflexi bacterium]|nr:alkaline phosphatase family protein [Chloroflexota bacterium]
MVKKIASLAVVPLFLLLWARLGSQNLTLFSFNALVNYPSPYLGALPPGQEGDTVAQQVLIVVVDALRADTSRMMPTVNLLRATGADRTARVGQPSFSLPGWTVIGTGAWQEQSGVTLNFYDKDIKVDTLFEAAKRKGLTTALVAEGPNWWKRLYTRGVDILLDFPDPEHPFTDLAAVRRQDDAIEAAARQVLRENKPNLMLVHFIEPDDAGHGQGAASDAYKQAVLTADARIARLVAAMDLSQATVFVTGDHGMLDRGGHGGWEPEVTTVPIVAAGKGIKPGKYSEATQADLAPTAAVLLGTSLPAHNQGQPLFDMLDISVELRAKRAVDTADEISTRYAQIMQVLGGPAIEHKKLEEAKQALGAGNWDAAYQAATADIQGTWKQAADARDARLNRERLARLPIAIIVLVPFVVYLVIMRRAKWDWRVPVIGLVVYNVVYNGLYFGRGLTWSLSMFNDESQIVDFFTARTVDAMLALVAAALVVGILSRRRGAYETALNTINLAFWVAFVLAVQIELFYWLYDVSFSWYLPDMMLGVKYYLDVLQTGAFWPMVYVPLLLVLPLIALGGRGLAARVRGK